MDRSSHTLDLDAAKAWIGRTETVQDVITPRLVDSLTATIDSERHFPARAKLVPVMLHWCLAPPVAPLSGLGADGHPAKGGFLPPIPLPRRMWAGGAIEFSGRLSPGDIVERRSRIAAIDSKQGQSGLLCFVTVEHTITTEFGAVVKEQQDIVYRGPDQAQARPGAAREPKRTPMKARHRLTMTSDSVLLFRYSALTFNGHRIHYDRRYAMEQEGYAGLVVHGPLQASLLAEYGAELNGGRPPRRFKFRGVQPLFDRDAFTLNAAEAEDGLSLWIEDSAGQTTMTAQASW